MELVPKAYVPWSEDGCSLAEARERTADRVTWKRWQEITNSSSLSSTDESEKIALKKVIDACCIDHLESGRLVAYGSLGTKEAPRQLILAESWTGLTTVDWTKSVIANGRLGASTFFDVLVFPLLFAPNRVDLLGGKSLADAFACSVLNDVEVAALAADAIRLSPEYKNVFIEGRCHVHGIPEWPLAFERSSMIGAVHPDPALRSWLDGKPDVLEVFTASEALIHRYCALISLLRKRDLSAYGVPAEPNVPGKVLHAIWSHEHFHLEMSSGDILQDNPASTGRFDRLTRRWLAVVLERGVGTDLPSYAAVNGTQYRDPTESETRGPTSVGSANARNSSAMFHVQPTLPHDLRSDTTDIQQRQGSSRKGIARVETSAATRNACLKWFIRMMKASPKVRGPAAKTLWVEAQKNWPNLSNRQFQAARAEAIQKTGAAAWGAAGAPPKKNLGSNRRGD